MRYFQKIEGERLYLSPMNPDDLVTYTQWVNDQAVAGNLGIFHQNISLENEKKMLESMVSEGQNYAIVLREGDVLLGNVSLNEIDHISRKATTGLFIGEAGQRGKGYGAEALRLILGYSFKTLNLHNIMLLVHADNQRAIACYQKVGFREFGRRREAVFKDGRYIDIVYMEMLSNEFSQ